MCDQDHFERDRQEYESRGLVTRKQFGIALGAGIVIMLPQTANAVAVTESDVAITTPDGTADAYFVHPASGTAPGVLVWPDIFGLRPSFRGKMAGVWPNLDIRSWSSISSTGQRNLPRRKRKRKTPIQINSARWHRR